LNGTQYFLHKKQISCGFFKNGGTQINNLAVEHQHPDENCLLLQPKLTKKVNIFLGGPKLKTCFYGDNRISRSQGSA